MERLTTKRRDGRWALRNDDGATPKEQINKIPRAIDRLATYEDTGLEPETVSDLLERFIFFYRMVEGLDLIDPVHFGAFVDRVKRWQRAEKDGRLVVLPPNDPLTLEALREMDGEPVWICDPDGSDGMWALVDLEYELCRTAKGGIAIFDTYGKTWLAYRRKPEEG